MFANVYGPPTCNEECETTSPGGLDKQLGQRLRQGLCQWSFTLVGSSPWTGSTCTGSTCGLHYQCCIRYKYLVRKMFSPRSCTQEEQDHKENPTSSTTHNLIPPIQVCQVFHSAVGYDNMPINPQKSMWYYTMYILHPQNDNALFQVCFVIISDYCTTHLFP